MVKRVVASEFRRNEKVKALDDLPGVPRGSEGRVLLVDGFTWTRYRVAFANGRDIGSIDGGQLCRPKEYEAALAEREKAAAVVAEGASANGEDAEATPAPTGEGAVVGSASVPAHLLERSRRARGRLGG